MGWYATPTGVVRWWDGARWTGLRMKNGVPGSDWATYEQPGAAFAFGGIFLLLGVSQLALALVSPGPSVSGTTMFVLGALWIAIGAQSAAVRRIPVPMGAPVAPDAVQPLPGTAEGPGAGWYPVTKRIARWWTGTRWSEYAATQFGVRPTFHGARAYRTFLILAWVLTGLGVVSVIVGVLLLVVGAEPPDYLLTTLGVPLLIVGIVIAAAGALLLGLSRRQRRILLLPTAPPVPATT